MIRVVLFDLDGVLIDSRADIVNSANVALKHFGFLELSFDEIVANIGHGSKNLILNCILQSCLKAHKHFDTDDLPKILEWYIDYYNSHAVVKTTLYDGVIDLFNFLSVNDIRMAIVSNKPVKITQTILEYFDIQDYFDTIIGPEKTNKTKPAPDGLICATNEINTLLQAIGETSLQKSEVLMVGDSAVDIQAAKAFGCLSCGCTEGIGNATAVKLEAPTILVKTVADLNSQLYRNRFGIA